MATAPGIIALAILAILALLALSFAYFLGKSDGEGKPMKLSSLALRIPPSDVLISEGLMKFADGYTVYQVRERFSKERLLCYSTPEMKIIRDYNLKSGEHFSVRMNGDGALEIIHHNENEKIEIPITFPYAYPNNQTLL